MANDKERGLHELYREDPEKADAEIWGRKVSPVSRRGFLQGAGLAAMTAAVGARIVHQDKMPQGLIPAAFADETKSFVIKGKEDIRVLNDRPVNAEAYAHQLNEEVTPTKYVFVRNNGLIPEAAKKMDATGWTLTVDGEVDKTLTLSLDDLKKNFKAHELNLQYECGGNGRAGYNPPAKGNQWTVGAVACRLKDVLNAAGLKKSAVYTAYYGGDTHLSGDPDKVPISRGTPIAKALDDYSMIVWEMNGEPLHAMNGFPLRLVIPGWPGSCSGKWLKRIWIRDQVHDGPKMTGTAYRVPKNPVAPGTEVPEEDFEIIERMPVKSLITSPKTGSEHSLGKSLPVRGHAWVGDLTIDQVDLSTDFGSTWTAATLKNYSNPHAWRTFEAHLKFPQKGYYEIWARAKDSEGRMQPMVVPGWNPKGYLNNSCHRVAVTVV